MPHTAVLRTARLAVMVMAAPTIRSSPTTRSTPWWSAPTKRDDRDELGDGGYCTRFSDRPWSVVGCDDGASLDFAVVEELVGLGCAVQREVFD